MGIFSKSERVGFFNYFESAAKNILEGASMLSTLTTNFNDAQNIAKRIKDIEHEADKITHNTVNELNKTFVTPIDREDIHDLIMQLDNIIDFIDATASRIVLYEIKSPTQDLATLISILQKSVVTLVSAVMKFKDFKRCEETMKELIEINRLENEGDQALRSAMANLLNNEKDAIKVIKLKEIYENIENAIDRCEDVANILEGIILKNA